MKKIAFSIILVILFATIAYAKWEVEFEDTYIDKGIDQAVVEALKAGALPEGIVQLGLDLEGLNPQNLIMALYCAGVKGDEIRDAAFKYDISEQIVSAGYKKSTVECGDIVADSQAYTPVASGFSGGRTTSGGGGTFASVSGFNQ